MKNNKSKRVLLILLGMLIAAVSLAAGEAKVKLDRGEKEFKPIASYTLKDFHFAKEITYLDIAEFQTRESDDKHFSLPKKIKFYIHFQSPKGIDFPYKKQAWLAKAILKPGYFWKTQLHPFAIYSFTTMRFLEKGDRRFKAITELSDIRDIFGEIDTEAELRIWLKAISKDYLVHSWKKIGKLYRVRYAGLDPFSCYYIERFNYFDSHGRLIKSKKLKDYRVKKCTIINL